MKRPTKPGYYWVRREPDWKPEVAQVVFHEITCETRVLKVIFFEGNYCEVLEEVHEWIAKVAPLKRRKK